jgi:hypothetical protein
VNLEPSLSFEEWSVEGGAWRNAETVSCFAFVVVIFEDDDLNTRTHTHTQCSLALSCRIVFWSVCLPWPMQVLLRIALKTLGKYCVMQVFHCCLLNLDCCL